MYKGTDISVYLLVYLNVRSQAMQSKPSLHPNTKSATSPTSPTMASKVDSDFTAIDATPSADVDKAIKANSNDKDLDVGAELANYLADEGYTAEEERSLRWKMDLRIIPILWLNICMGAMDKVSTSTAALYGMIPDTGLTGNRYSWVGSSFYVRVTLQ